MYQITFKILDTMGYIEENTQKNQHPHVRLRGAAVVTFTISCGSYIIFANLEVMTKYCTRRSENQWQKVLDPLPKKSACGWSALLH